jgi:hypothetical protein
MDNLAIIIFYKLIFQMEWSFKLYASVNDKVIVMTFVCLLP